MISILLAEDDRALSALVKTYLIDGGYEVTACFDGTGNWYPPPQGES